MLLLDVASLRLESIKTDARHPHLESIQLSDSAFLAGGCADSLADPRRAPHSWFRIIGRFESCQKWHQVLRAFDERFHRATEINLVDVGQ